MRNLAATSFLIALCFLPLHAQAPRAILADGAGPWQTAQWSFTVSQFSSLLSDAGYSVTIVSPVDLPGVLPSSGTLLAVPSLESLPVATFNAIAAHVSAGGSLMASGGPPFSNPLYLTPAGQWLNQTAYQQAVGSSPPQLIDYIVPYIPTVSPSSQQYTNSAGLQVPIARFRGLTSSPNVEGRYRVIGDLLAPAATLFLKGSIIAWLPWPQLFDPFRGELISALQQAPNQMAIIDAGPDQLLWLPGETVTGGALLYNGSNAPVQANLQWSVKGASGSLPQPPIPFTLAAQSTGKASFQIPNLANGDYTLNFQLMVGNQQVDSVASPVRVLDPMLTRQPDQKIKVVNGAFVTAGGQHVFLRGVNYWPRYVAGLDGFFGQSWFESSYYDPDLVEADLAEISALGFNLVNIQFTDYVQDWSQEGRAVIDFLERCRNHGIWARIDLNATVLNGSYAGQLSPTLDNYLQAAYLAGNDRVFAYELLWEPLLGTHDTGGAGDLINGAVTGINTGRTVFDPDWLTWVNQQYGSLANAQQAWNFTAPLNAAGQLTNPLDDQIENDGPWRIMVAAYRRFLEDYLGRNLGVVARAIRRTDPDTLLTYRNWVTMTAGHNADTGYDIGTAAAHLDFFSPERYDPVLPWPDDRAYGLVTAYSRYRTGGKPVQWTEFGADVSATSPTAVSQAEQAAICDTMMRLVADDGSNAESVWWWPGGVSPLAFTSGGDYGIVNPDGSPRDSALDLAQWNATFAAAVPDLVSSPSTTITVDRDADARGSYGLFLNYQNSYLQARQAGMSVVLADAGTGTDTSSMPLTQVGDVLYAGSGPLQYANAEFAGIHIVCPTLDVTVENLSTVALPAGAACQFTPTLVNTGEARWLAASASKGGVTLQTSAGNLALVAPLPSLQRTPLGPLNLTMGQGATTLTGRMMVSGVGAFGELLDLSLTVDSTLTGPCATSLSSSGAISAPAAGTAGAINVSTAPTCNWTATSADLWLTVTPAGGSGNGAVTYTIAANYGPPRQTTLTIAGRPFTVTESGVTNPTLAGAPVLSSANLTFGRQTVGTAAAPQRTTLTNSGAAAIQMGAVAVGGQNSGDFAESDNCGAALAVAASCTIQVIFVPSAAGTRTASLFVTGGIATGPQAVALAGTGLGTGPAASIQAIVDSWGYTTGIAPGLWVTIGGTNLGGAPQTWDLDGVSQLPTSLGSVSVTFNGAPAAMLYVSGPQINALVPASVAPGPVTVVAQVNGVPGSAFSITAAATHPAVYALPSADGSTFFVTAALAGTATLVGNSAIDPRVVRAVYPGDTIDLYMIGLGATLDPSQFITSQVFAGAFPVSAAVTASVGGEPANVLFSGLTTPGLYLVRIVVPADLAAGAQPLQVTAAGVPTRPSLVLQMALPPPA